MPEERYWRSNSLIFHSGSYERLLFQEGDRPSAVSLPLADLLESCRDFESLETHAAGWWKSLTFGQKRMALKDMIVFLRQRSETIHLSTRLGTSLAVQVLGLLKQQNYLCSKADLLQFWSQSSSRVQANSISRLAVVTKDRQDFLSRCLNSYAENASFFDDRLNFVIFDDSMSQDSEALITKWAEDFYARWGQSISYCGKKQKSEFRNALVSAGIDATLLDFCFWGGSDESENYLTYGANRNAFLLDGIGELSLSVDDDTFCRIGTSEKNTSARLADPNDHTHFRFFSSRDEALKSVSLYSGSFKKMHERGLGRSLPDLLNQSLDWEKLKFSELGPLIHQLMHLGKGHIVSTFQGLAGDSASTDPLHVLGYMARRFEPQFENENVFRDSLSHREILRTLDQPYIYPLRKCMMTAFGLDQRDVLAPFFPLFRQEDSIFGDVMSFIDRESLMMHLPYTLDHLPETGRQYSTIYFEGKSEFWPVHAFEEAFRSLPLPSLIVDRERALKIMGFHLEAVGEGSFRDYQMKMRAAHWNRIAQSISYYEYLLDTYKKMPVHWRKFVFELRQKTRQNLSYPAFLAPPWLVMSLGQEAAERKVKSWISQYGKLLQAWPDIWEAALCLKKKGQTLSKKIK